MVWTRFHDCHSNGGTKTEWDDIFIEAPENRAKRIFKDRFKLDPDHASCSCCGHDWDIDEQDDTETWVPRVLRIADEDLTPAEKAHSGGPCPDECGGALELIGSICGTYLQCNECAAQH